jgi:multidrug efflux pump subunit AcrB
MATNYQSWLDPMLIMMALPGAFAGVLWMLVLTHTTLNVESLMGSIMAVGVATTNGNLLITFANEHMEKEGVDPLTAAIEAGTTRLRPVLMTALAGNAAHVAGAWCRRRAECAPRACGNWRPDRSDLYDSAGDSDGLFDVWFDPGE